jgi:tripartite-type tricarboxylate transporter receptor subunit TctC
VVRTVCAVAHAARSHRQDQPRRGRAAAQSEARDALLAQGAEAVPTSPEEFAAFQKNEISKWGKVIRDAHIVAQ